MTRGKNGAIRSGDGPTPRGGDHSVIEGIRGGRPVVRALRNRADLAIDLLAASPTSQLTGDFAVAMSGLGAFAASFALEREIRVPA
jgi:hypothetical protein